jgi:hypothetical protein
LPYFSNPDIEENTKYMYIVGGIILSNMLYLKVAIVVFHCRAENELLDVYCENRDYPKVIRTLVKIFPIHFVILEDLIICMKVSKKKTEIIRCSIFIINQTVDHTWAKLRGVIFGGLFTPPPPPPPTFFPTWRWLPRPPPHFFGVSEDSKSEQILCV